MSGTETAGGTQPMIGDDAKRLRDLYLEVMRKCLLGTIYEDPAQDAWSKPVFDSNKRDRGLDWPLRAHTMIGNQRLTNLQRLAEQVLDSRIPGDFIETGIWRGGACILMRAVLKAYGITDRVVYAADSFRGLPEPDPELYPADRGDVHHTYDALAVSIEEVQANFVKYGLLDRQVVFLKGWFRDTLHRAPIGRLALLRLDGDMYESTMEAFVALYDKLSIGGFVIVDDYGAVPACRQAVHDFRRERAIGDTIQAIDGIGVYWQRSH